MTSVPPNWIEAAAGLLIPPACREEVLGDLYERYAGLPQYIMDAVRAVPLVILGRVRRTTDPGVCLMEALALYLSLPVAASCIDEILEHTTLAMVCRKVDMARLKQRGPAVATHEI